MYDKTTHICYKPKMERNCYTNFVKNVNKNIDKKVDMNLVKGDEFFN